MEQQKIDIRDLEILLEDAKTFQRVANQYFEPVHGLKSKILVKPKVDLQAPPLVLGGKPLPTSLKLQGSGISDLVIDAEIKNRRKKYLDKKDRPGVTRVVAEGDSWFQHPLIFDLLDCIAAARNDFAMLALARAGGTFQEMIEQNEYAPAVAEEQPKYFLLSAGGNDFLGDVHDYLRIPPKGKDGTAKEYLADTFWTLLRQLDTWLRRAIKEVLVTPSVERVILHGYDYAIPRKVGDNRFGRWLGEPMNQMGIPPMMHAKIVKEMTDEYFSVLSAVSKEPAFGGKVRLVDFRGMLTKNIQWQDEIHPSSSSFKKLAAEMLKLMP